MVKFEGRVVLRVVAPWTPRQVTHTGTQDGS